MFFNFTFKEDIKEHKFGIINVIQLTHHMDQKDYCHFVCMFVLFCFYILVADFNGYACAACLYYKNNVVNFMVYSHHSLVWCIYHR